VHEYSIVRALVVRVEQEARARHALAVHRLSVKVGALAGVEPELLASAYEIARERTLCAAAELLIESVPARWVCSACAGPIAAGAVLACAACGAPARLAEGGELLLERIDLEVPDV